MKAHFSGKKISSMLCVLPETESLFDDEIHAQLKSIPHSYIVLTNKHTVFTFYCATSKESSIVKQLVNKYDAKYFVSENRITL